MRVTIVGSGDAFATGGRAHTCIKIDVPGSSVIVDFGAGSIVAWKALGLGFDTVDTVLISHLHGDHFGGLPFMLLDCQFGEVRSKPLTFVGPRGLRQRLEAVFEAFYPEFRKIRWKFAWQVEEIEPRRTIKLGAFRAETFEVTHLSSGLATGVRLSDGVKVFAYSGDTAWTDTLYDLAADADLFLVECFSGADPVPNHMDWPTLAGHLAGFSAKQIVVTHMGQSAFVRRAEMERVGLAIAHDGRVFDL